MWGLKNSHNSNGNIRDSLKYALCIICADWLHPFATGAIMEMTLYAGSLVDAKVLSTPL